MNKAASIFALALMVTACKDDNIKAIEPVVETEPAVQEGYFDKGRPQIYGLTIDPQSNEMSVAFNVVYPKAGIEVQPDVDILIAVLDENNGNVDDIHKISVQRPLSDDAEFSMASYAWQPTAAQAEHLVEHFDRVRFQIREHRQHDADAAVDHTVISEASGAEAGRDEASALEAAAIPLAEQMGSSELNEGRVRLSRLASALDPTVTITNTTAEIGVLSFANIMCMKDSGIDLAMTLAPGQAVTKTYLTDDLSFAVMTNNVTLQPEYVNRPGTIYNGALRQFLAIVNAYFKSSDMDTATPPQFAGPSTPPNTTNNWPHQVGGLLAELKPFSRTASCSEETSAVAFGFDIPGKKHGASMFSASDGIGGGSFDYFGPTIDGCYGPSGLGGLVFHYTSGTQLDIQECTTPQGATDNANWMATTMPTGSDSEKSWPLNQLPLPGAHDAATHSLLEGFYYKSSSDCNSSSYSADIRFFRDTIYNWAVTQRYDFVNLLELGVRWLDMRVAYMDGEFDAPAGWRHLHTNWSGNTMSEDLAAIADWAAKHPEEIIFVDYQDICFTHGATAASFNDALKKKAFKIDGFESNSICDVAYFTHFPWQLGTEKISDIRASGKNVILLLDSSAAKMTAPFCGMLWSDDPTAGPDTVPLVHLWPDISGPATLSTGSTFRPGQALAANPDNLAFVQQVQAYPLNQTENSVNLYSYDGYDNKHWFIQAQALYTVGENFASFSNFLSSLAPPPQTQTWTLTWFATELLNPNVTGTRGGSTNLLEDWASAAGGTVNNVVTDDIGNSDVIQKMIEQWPQPDQLWDGK